MHLTYSAGKRARTGFGSRNTELRDPRACIQCAVEIQLPWYWCATEGVRLRAIHPILAGTLWSSPILGKQKQLYGVQHSERYAQSGCQICELVNSMAWVLRRKGDRAKDGAKQSQRPTQDISSRLCPQDSTRRPTLFAPPTILQDSLA